MDRASWTLSGLGGGGPEVLFSSDKSDTRCEGILLEEITSQIPIFTAFLLGPPRILECRYQLYSNDLSHLSQNSTNPGIAPLFILTLAAFLLQTSLILPPPLPWVNPWQVLAGLSPEPPNCPSASPMIHELPETERILLQFCLQTQTDCPWSNLWMAPKPSDPSWLLPFSSSLSPPTNSLLFLKCTLRPQYIYISSFCLDSSLLYLVNSYSSFRTQFKYHLLFRTSLIPPGRVVSFLSGVLLCFTRSFVIKGIYHFVSYLLHDMRCYDCLLHNKAA